MGTDLKDAVGADDFARTFHQAAAIILQEAIASHEREATAPARASAVRA